MVHLKRVKQIVPPLIPAIVISLVTEISVRMGWVKDYILPAPSQVFAALVDERAELLTAFWQTGSAASIGLLSSFLIGFGIALTLSSSVALRRAFLPYAVFFQTVPVIAVAPLLVIWFGFGMPTVVASAFVVSIFPIIASTLLGLQSTDPALLDLFRLYSASRFDQLVRLRIPFAAPQIFSGLRIAAGLAVIGAVVGEFIGGGGLGSFVDAARNRQRTDLVFAAVILASILGLFLQALVNFLANRSLRHWHASERSSLR
jgi:NitT/TauT family transport system permease protein